MARHPRSHRRIPVRFEQLESRCLMSAVLEAMADLPLNELVIQPIRAIGPGEFISPFLVSIAPRAAVPAAPLPAPAAIALTITDVAFVSRTSQAIVLKITLKDSDPPPKEVVAHYEADVILNPGPSPDPGFTYTTDGNNDGVPNDQGGIDFYLTLRGPKLDDAKSYGLGFVQANRQIMGANGYWDPPITNFDFNLSDVIIPPVAEASTPHAGESPLPPIQAIDPVELQPVGAADPAPRIPNGMQLPILVQLPDTDAGFVPVNIVTPDTLPANVGGWSPDPGMSFGSTSLPKVIGRADGILTIQVGALHDYRAGAEANVYKVSPVIVDAAGNQYEMQGCDFVKNAEGGFNIILRVYLPDAATVGTASMNLRVSINGGVQGMLGQIDIPAATTTSVSPAGVVAPAPVAPSTGFAGGSMAPTIPAPVRTIFGSDYDAWRSAYAQFSDSLKAIPDFMNRLSGAQGEPFQTISIDDTFEPLSVKKAMIVIRRAAMPTLD